MSIWNQYPYTDFHELNLDWIIKMVKEVTKEMNDFKVVNQIVWGGLHDPGKEYPRFCIVDTPTHEGYISIQPVPAGITIDNEDYWRQVANYSALYADFQNRIVSLENTVNDIQTELANIKKRRFIMIGDSYGGLPDGDGHTYFEIVQNALSLSNDDFYHANLGGAAFSDANPTYTFLGILQSIEANVTEKDTITDIFVVGGANDAARTPSDTLTAIADFMTYVKATYPMAKVSLFGCGVTFTAYTMEANFDNLVTTWKEGAKYGATFIPGSEYVLRNTKFLADHDLCHPKPDGVSMIGLKLVEAINNGAVDVFYRMKMENPATITVPGVTATPYSIFSMMEQKNGNVSISTFGASPYGVRFNCDSAVNLSVGDSITLQFTDSLIAGYNSDGISLSSKEVVVYDLVTGKGYKATLTPRLTVANRLDMVLYMRDAIPSSDNVTAIAVDLGGYYFE